MVLGVCEAGNGMDFWFHKEEPMHGERAVHEQPTAWFGTVKNSLDCFLDQDCP